MVVLAGVLTGCQRGGGAPATSAMGTPSTGSSAAGPVTAATTGVASTSAAGCPEPLASNTYVRASTARAEGATVVVTAHPARRVCGGPNNGHYEIGTATDHLTVTASATVVLLTTTPTGLGHETVAPTDLPQRLADDRFGRIFLVRGPLTAVTSMEEQFHP